ncbi:hypothetical protein [Pseudoalteromonas sp. GB56]
MDSLQNLTQNHGETLSTTLEQIEFWGKTERKFLVELLVVFLDLGKSVETKKALKEKYGEYFEQKSRDIPI